MIPGFFKKDRKKSQKKKRQRKKNRTLIEKKIEWTKRWGLDDYKPFWDLNFLPSSIRELIDIGLIPKETTVVDIGCGSGYLSAHLAEEGFRVIGFDFAETAIERARKNYPEIQGKLKFHTADATKPLPFQDTFQIGIDRGTFHTLPMKNRADYVEHISPFIEEGGLLIMMYALRIAKKLVETSKDDPAVLLKDHLTKLFDGSFIMQEYRSITMASKDQQDTLGFLIIFKRK